VRQILQGDLMFGFHKIHDFDHERSRLTRARYGVIEIRNGKLDAIYLRPFPTIVSRFTVLLSGNSFHRSRAGDVCYLYYNQPIGYANFLALKYAVSSHECTMASINAALIVLDEIARLKQTDALLCDAANLRFSPRMLQRYGWEPHAPSRWHNHHIRRFYGVYPTHPRRDAILARHAASPTLATT
jgi:hypothetical protein